MVHWIYVLECEDDYIYVGETTRLFRRFREHLYRNGSVNTSIHEPVRLIGLYKLNDNYSFYKYRNEIRNGEYNPFTINEWLDKANEQNHLFIENRITELYFSLRSKSDERMDFRYEDGDWWKIRGGKYIQQYINNPFNNINEEDILDRPMCGCELPCEVKISNNGERIYFVCALKNVWDDMGLDIEVEAPCDFFKVYKDDIYIKKQYELIQNKLSEHKWVINLPISRYNRTPERCIFCKKEQYVPVFCYGNIRNICQPCFSNKFEELKKKYDYSSTCMFADDD